MGNRVRKEDRIGLTNYNTDGLLMTIIEYYDSQNLIVEFEDKEIKRVAYKEFCNGHIKHPKMIIDYKKRKTR